MSVTMHQTRRDALLNSVRSPEPIKAKVDENFVHNASRLLRKAIGKTGMSHDEAMDALGFVHKGEFSEALDGKRKIWLHQLLRREAVAIRRELLILSEVEQGTGTVERVVRLTETA